MKECQYCHKLFEPTKRAQGGGYHKYCSTECRIDNFRVKHGYRAPKRTPSNCKGAHQTLLPPKVAKNYYKTVPSAVGALVGPKLKPLDIHDRLCGWIVSHIVEKSMPNHYTFEGHTYYLRHIYNHYELFDDSNSNIVAFGPKLLMFEGRVQVMDAGNYAIFQASGSSPSPNAS